MLAKHEKPSERLPHPSERWVSRRKAMVIAALREGETTVAEVCRLYSLSRDELASWIASFERHGVPGLRATRVQLYRQLENAKGGRAVGQHTAYESSFGSEILAGQDPLPSVLHTQAELDTLVGRTKLP